VRPDRDRPGACCDFDIAWPLTDQARAHRVFSPTWCRAHRTHHLARFPDVDQVTVDNLDQLVRYAEQLDHTR